MKKINFNNKYSKLQWGLICIICIFLGFIFYQGFVFYQFKVENSRLAFLKNEYVEIINEIESYKKLKGQYEIVLSDNNDLIGNKDALEKKIEDLNKEIKDYEEKINDINKKIKSLS